ncbi:MAG: S8 family serine peptidase [Bdellovibrionota bacterium]
MNVKINNSWEEVHLFKHFTRDGRSNELGLIFVAAAGNDALDTDSFPHYPSNYPNENIVSVAALNEEGHLASFSNYGWASVDIAAPGDNVLSTVLNHGYESLRGTSMATPHVSGALAVLLSKYPNLSAKQAVELLYDTAKDNIASYRGDLDK